MHPVAARPSTAPPFLTTPFDMHSSISPQAGKISYEDAKELHWFAVFYRTGSVIFGGGQVMPCGRQSGVHCPPVHSASSMHMHMDRCTGPSHR